jgi:hypothetical protein
MTLILACLTQELAVPASDRRVTTPDGSIRHDDTNKTVSLCGHFILGYTDRGD